MRDPRCSFERSVEKRIHRLKNIVEPRSHCLANGLPGRDPAGTTASLKSAKTRYQSMSGTGIPRCWA